MTAAEVRIRAEHARDSLLTAQARFKPGGPMASNNTTGLNAVNAGIAAADAICGSKLGYRSSGQDHKQAIGLLSQALPEKKAAGRDRDSFCSRSRTLTGASEVPGKRIPDRVSPISDPPDTELLCEFRTAAQIALVTKTDAASKSEIAQRLMEVNELGQWETIIPVSGLLGDQLEIVVEEILALMPESEPLYSLEDSTEQSLEVRIQELIREATLEGVSDELPHSIAVTIDEMGEREDGLMQIFANLWVERDSQKGIMIGKGGQKLKGIGQLARTGIQELMSRPVYLSLQVKVSKEWQRDPKKLDKLGL